MRGDVSPTVGNDQATDLFLPGVLFLLSKRSSLRKPNRTTGGDENTKHSGTLCGLQEAAMACEACGSANDPEFSAEINIHFPGPMSLDEPGFFVFPKLAVCLDCGFTQFTLPERELCMLKKVLARRRKTHIENYTDAA
jgi:hypothetical protein